MGIGIATITVLAATFWATYKYLALADLTKRTFDVAAIGLAVSAVVELGYMLFTPGPDEAIGPIQIGFSAALLFIAAQTTSFSIGAGIGAVLFVLALAGLFAIRREYTDDM